MTREENIRAILECYFTGFKDEMIDSACERICELEYKPYICDSCKHKDAGWDTEPCDGCCGNHSGYEPCTVSVSEKEPDEISEEVTLRFFRNSLKVRWQDMVIYNVEWLKKNWQMEMDIVCGVKPCEDAVSRQAVLDAVNDVIAYYIPTFRAFQKEIPLKCAWAIRELPSVRPQEQTGHWIEIDGDDPCWYMCSECHRQSDIKENYCPNCGAKMESEEKE